jgi:hypothetical protein
MACASHRGQPSWGSALMDDQLPVKYEQLFAILDQELQQVPPTSMSQGMQDFLEFMRTHREQFKKLAQCGADLYFIAHVLYVLKGFSSKYSLTSMTGLIPCKDHRQALRQASKKLPALQCLRHTVAQKGFSTLSAELREAIRAELWMLRQARNILGRGIFKKFQRLKETDPLAILLAQAQPTSRGRGRPSAVVSTLFMVLLTDHLQERTNRRHYPEVGRVTYHLFASSISKQLMQEPQELTVAVQDRCKKFRKTHNVAALRRALIATEKPFLEQPCIRLAVVHPPFDFSARTSAHVSMRPLPPLLCRNFFGDIFFPDFIPS